MSSTVRRKAQNMWRGRRESGVSSPHSVFLADTSDPHKEGPGVNTSPRRPRVSSYPISSL